MTLPIERFTVRQKITVMVDRYTVALPASANGRRLDWRAGAAMVVALDALQSR